MVCPNPNKPKSKTLIDLEAAIERIDDKETHRLCALMTLAASLPSIGDMDDEQLSEMFSLAANRCYTAQTLADAIDEHR
jgi:hypothetical protein